MAILTIQIAGALVSVFIVYLTYVKFKKKEFSVGEASFWISFWLVSGYLFIFPKTVNPLVEALNIKRPLDLYIIVAVFFWSVITYLNYLNVRRIKNKIETLVREVALWQK